MENRPKSGRPRKLSRRDVSLIIKEVTTNPKITAPKIADSIAAASGKSVHPKTVARALRETNLQTNTRIWMNLLGEESCLLTNLSSTFSEAMVVQKFGVKQEQHIKPKI